MKVPSLTLAKKYSQALKKCKGKYVSSEKLAKVIGFYPDVINDFFSYFNPMVNIDYTFNLRELEDELNEFIANIESNRDKSKKQELITKKKLDEYTSINDFIFKKMTNAGGMVDRNIELSDTDLRILKKLIIEEQTKRKKK
ncbi:MAG: hypothetical protein ACI31G_02995 [Bacilli bacterium]